VGVSVVPGIMRVDEDDRGDRAPRDRPNGRKFTAQHKLKSFAVLVSLTASMGTRGGWRTVAKAASRASFR
jgi:hypothetical protein